ncbi:helical backbone metal receptor, partial [Elusimicrobiota bacterium]
MKKKVVVCIVLYQLLVAWICVYADSCPERIISLGPAMTERVFLLGCGDNIVANTTYCKRPAAASSKEKIGSVVAVDLEKIVAMKPDLVVAISLTRDKTIRKMKKLGLRVEVFKEPKDFKHLL